MAVGEYPSVDPGLMRALMRHLEHLKNRPDGGELHQLIYDALLYCRANNYVNGSSVAYLHDLLLAFTRDHTHSTPLRVRARLIQQHLALYLPNPDHTAKSAQAKITPLPISLSQRVAPQAAETPGATSLIRHENYKPKTKPTEIILMESEGAPATKPMAPVPETQHHAAHDTPQKLHELRQILANGMDSLVRERETLAQQLSDATSYLKMIEAEREQLRAELNKARKRSRISEKPAKKLGLPKRDVLVRQIESEVERVKRHGNPLALALIDIDNLNTIESQHGQEVTKAVLDHYTGEILGGFRSYDMIARYSKDEFALLLPNTDKDRAMRALEKVRKRANESHFSHKGKSYPLPGFGGVLTFYAPGEESLQMLRRADEALVNLKLRGEREVVVV
ncbi:MAG: GGDEF domain-containing protein [Sulfuricaulis sp.]